MTQLLIVDDEVHVVERLHATINWESIGIEQVYKAFSGREALELLEQFSIDIVISDIQMPDLSGLQLIGEINDRWPKTKCILLSGHSDFHYAKEAILKRTEDYLLKPVTEQQLLATVQRVKEKLQQEWEELLSRQRLVYTLREHLPLLRGTLLNDLLQGRHLSRSSLSDKMQALELPVFDGARIGILMVRLESVFLEYDWQRLALTEYAVTNMVEELFGEKYDSWQTKDLHDYLVYVMKPKGEQKEPNDTTWFERTATDLQSAVKSYLKGSISVLVSPWGRFPEDLLPLYNRSLSEFRKRIGHETGLFVKFGGQVPPADLSTMLSLYDPPTLHHLLEAARWSEIEEKLRKMFEELEARYTESQEHLLEVFFTIASAYTYIAHKNGRQLHLLLDGEYNRLTEGVPFRSVHQLRDWAYRSLELVRRDMEQETKDNRESLINDIRSFIERRLSSDVSLQMIADHVHLHPVYVSKIYKLETGENVSEYLNRVKMEKAEYLLKHSQDKIYEIAAQLGYQRPHSFNHAFKKQFGMTPQEYRDQF